MGVLSPSPAATPGSTSARAERGFDYLLAISVTSWALLGLLASAPSIPVVRWATSLLHLSVGVAVLRRSPLREGASPRELASSLPALVVAGLAFGLAAPLDEWPVRLELVFAAGAGLAVWSFAALGESFAVLPARRDIVSRGPYRVVRHPAYVGEVLMILACALSHPSLGAAFILAVVLPLVALRIRAEEALLSKSVSYRRYRDAVGSRFIPHVW